MATTEKDFRVKKGIIVTENATVGGALTVTDSIGIGVSNPTFSVGSGLQIVRTGEIAAIELEQSDANTPGKLEIFGGNNGNGFVNRTAKPFYFSTDNQVRMRIEANGNVGIGLSNPSEKLEVNGTVKATQFSGSITGNADTASKWETSRTITLTGDVTGSVSIDGSSDVTITTTASADSVELGTDTTGNYMVDVSAGSGISISHTQSEGSTATISHANTSSVSNLSSDNSNGTVLQDISLSFDEFGHVSTATIGTVNLDDRYYTETEADSRFVNVTGDDITGNLTVAGNVGIGTTIPETILHVKGITDTGNVFLIDCPGGDSPNFVMSGAGEQTFRFHNTALEGSTRVSWKMADRVNPDWRWIMYTDIFEDGSETFELRNRTSGAMIHINSTDVGIGTTNPVAKLDIAATGDGTELLRFSTEREWAFRQKETGSAARLQLASVVDLKWFDIINNDNTIVASFFASSSPRVGIATNDPQYTLEVNGSFAATTKSFVIDHPTKLGKKLRHGSLEGPENGVYVRGKLDGTNLIELPEYWTKLVDPDSITVQLTAIDKGQSLYVEDIRDNKVYVGNSDIYADEIKCFYIVHAERVDVEKLEVEID